LNMPETLVRQAKPGAYCGVKVPFSRGVDRKGCDIIRRRNSRNKLRSDLRNFKEWCGGMQFKWSRILCGSEYSRRARCDSSARRDLCGGRRATGGSTVTAKFFAHYSDMNKSRTFLAKTQIF